MPYLLLTVFVLLWAKPLAAFLNSYNVAIQWPGLHNMVQRMPPVVSNAAPYGAVYNFTWLSASGTACLIAALLSALVTGLSLQQFGKVLSHTCKQLALAELTLAAVLGARLPDELLGLHRHPRPGVRRHRRGLPLLQRHARLARRLPHRQRHLRQRARSAPCK